MTNNPDFKATTNRNVFIVTKGEHYRITCGKYTVARNVTAGIEIAAIIASVSNKPDDMVVFTDESLSYWERIPAPEVIGDVVGETAQNQP